MIEVTAKIRKIVNEWESLDKEEFIMDLLVMLGEEKSEDILSRLEKQHPMFDD